MRDNSDFYIKHKFSPTETQLDLHNQEVLSKYNDSRIYLFENCLKIPMCMLENSRYLEIGPDAGENAFSAASFGANVWCVDANALSIHKTRSLFQDSKLATKLKNLRHANFLDADFEISFNFVVAEGLIHSVENKTEFLRKISQISDSKAMIVISYYDKISIFGDLFHSRLFKVLLSKHLKIPELDGYGIEDAIKFGEFLFTNKWNSKGHLRSLRTWILDVLLNPAMQAERTLNPIDVMSQLQRVGICYWSSYPTYFNASKIRWHRDKQKYEDFLLEITKTYESRSLEFLLGVQLFSTSFLEIETSKIISQECTLLNTVLSDENWNAVAKSLENLKLICTNSVDFNLNEKTKILVILDMLINISTLVIAEQWDSIVRLILDSTSGVGFNFNDFWGHPNHYLALKKE